MRILAACIAAMAVLPSIAWADARPWASVDGSWGTYAMSDVNDDLAAVNASLAGSGLSIDEIHGGLGLGLRFGVEVGSRWSTGVGYDRLFASTDVGDATGKLEYKLPANAFRVFEEYSLPSQGRAGLNLGAGLGMVSSSGSVELTDYSSGSFKAHLKGTGLLLEGLLGGEIRAAPQLALTGSAGFRYAKISEVKAEGQTVVNADGSKYSLDYSGFLLRLGMKVAFTR
jgi:hypothetical protein